MEGEISPFNHDAVRGPSGFWNEHLLPVMAWEDPAQRVVLPATLVASLKLPISPVLRWDAGKYRDVVTKHRRDRQVIASLTEYLNDWRYHGEETGEHAGNQCILFQDGTGRWYAVSIGPLHGIVDTLRIKDRRIRADGSSRTAA